MSEQWEVRSWQGEEWPERRLSIAHKRGGAVAISPRYVSPDAALADFERIVKCVNGWDALESENAALKAECERLREALGLLLNAYDDDALFGDDPESVQAARQALRGEGGTE